MFIQNISHQFFRSIATISLFVSAVSQLQAADWELIKIVRPEVIEIKSDGSSSPSYRISRKDFEVAVNNVVSELRYYSVEIAEVKLVEPDQFYSKKASDDDLYLDSLLTGNQLIISGVIRINIADDKVDVGLEAYSKRLYTPWTAELAPFSLRSIDKMTEVYEQLLFDLLNQPGNGLSPSE